MPDKLGALEIAEILLLKNDLMMALDLKNQFFI
jgi:hypothetical protein